MIDLKSLQTVMGQLESEKGISKEVLISAIEEGLAHAYKKDYGKKDQIIRAKFDMNTGGVSFEQVKIAVDESMLKSEDEEDFEDEKELAEGEVRKVRFNPERHIMIDEAKKIKKGTNAGDEVIFPLDMIEDYGRIAAQTAKQVVIQKIREAERNSVYGEYKNKKDEIISGIVQRADNNNVFIDLGRATAVLPREEQVRGERYRIGERIRALLFAVEENSRGINLYLSRSHPKFLTKLFELEVPEIAGGIVEVKSVAREAGARSKIAVWAKDDVDPVGSCVGQKGIRVNTVIAELGGEKVDIIEWSENPEEFIAHSLSPAKILEVNVDNETKSASVMVDEDQLSLAIGKGGQNVRLAAKLTGWKIDIKSREGKVVAKADEDGEIKIDEEVK